jgi:hypothetical protein
MFEFENAQAVLLLGFTQKLRNKNFKLNLKIKWLVVVTKPLPINTKFPRI